MDIEAQDKVSIFDMILVFMKETRKENNKSQTESFFYCSDYFHHLWLLSFSSLFHCHPFIIMNRIHGLPFM